MKLLEQGSSEKIQKSKSINGLDQKYTDFHLLVQKKEVPVVRTKVKPKLERQESIKLPST